MVFPSWTIGHSAISGADTNRIQVVSMARSSDHSLSTKRTNLFALNVVAILDAWPCRPSAWLARPTHPCFLECGFVDYVVWMYGGGRGRISASTVLRAHRNRPMM